MFQMLSRRLLKVRPEPLPLENSPPKNWRKWKTWFVHWSQTLVTQICPTHHSSPDNSAVLRKMANKENFISKEKLHYLSFLSFGRMEWVFSRAISNAKKLCSSNFLFFKRNHTFLLFPRSSNAEKSLFLPKSSSAVPQ